MTPSCAVAESSNLNQAPMSKPVDRLFAGIVVAARDVVGTGGGTVALETASGLARLGFDVRLVVDSALSEDIAGVQVEITRFGQRLKSWVPRGKVAFRIRQLLQIATFSLFARHIVSRYERSGYVSIDHNIEAWGADIIVVHNVFIEQFRADRRSFPRKIPQFFNPIFGLRLIRERAALRSSRVKGVIAVSQSTLVEVGPLVGRGKTVAVIESGINLLKFHPLSEDRRQERRAAEGVGSKFVILFVGHEFERKRLDLAIKALSELPAAAQLWVIGGRMSSTQTYALLSDRLGVTDRVRFLGTRSDTASFFQMADAFVLPSDYETWGLVTLEAMACGVPAVMTPVGCALHVIQDGQTGYVVPPDPIAIAERMRRLIDSPELHAQMRRNARSMAETYSWENVTQAYLAFIEQVVSAREHYGT